MSSLTTSRHETAGIQRKELVAAAVEVATIFAIFIVAFTGRSTWGDGVRQLLIVLSAVAGALGGLAGLWVIWRGMTIESSRVPRIALGSFMACIGVYTIVHVL